MTDREESVAANSHIGLLVLALIGEEPMYGYRIIKELEARSNCYFQLKEGSLYPVLHQLEREGLVTAEWQQQEGRPNRRYYRITERGQGALQEAKQGFQAHVNAMKLVLEYTA